MINTSTFQQYFLIPFFNLTWKEDEMKKSPVWSGRFVKMQINFGIMLMKDLLTWIFVDKSLG